MIVEQKPQQCYTIPALITIGLVGLCMCSKKVV